MVFCKDIENYHIVYRCGRFVYCREPFELLFNCQPAIENRQSESGNPADEFKIIDDLFDNELTFNGLRNASVHKHIAIPVDASLGENHVEVVVIDEFGNSTMVDTLLYLVEDTEEEQG